MECLSYFEIQTISERLSVYDIMKLCITCKYLNKQRYSLLSNRQIEVQTQMNKKQWCRICETIVNSNTYILFMCTCHNSDNFPYYHISCLDTYHVTRNYLFDYCPKCKKRKPLLICNKSS